MNAFSVLVEGQKALESKSRTTTSCSKPKNKPPMKARVFECAADAASRLFAKPFDVDHYQCEYITWSKEGVPRRCTKPALTEGLNMCLSHVQATTHGNKSSKVLNKIRSRVRTKILARVLENRPFTLLLEFQDGCGVLFDSVVYDKKCGAVTGKLDAQSGKDIELDRATIDACREVGLQYVEPFDWGTVE